MARLIDADALEANIQKMFKPYGDGTYPGDYTAMIHDETLVDVLETIEEAPTVDVVPVVHGRWYLADDGYCRCSNCTQKAPIVPQYQDEPMTTMTNYCPNCGAKMDGDGNG